MTKKLNIALIGCGNWGKNIARNLHQIGALACIYDANQSLSQKLNKDFKLPTYTIHEIFENEKTPTLSLVECRLETGRTHQIRVHMAFKGNNILGDKKYKKRYKKIKNIDSGQEKIITNLDRQFLHAKTIGFIHPKTGEEMEFRSNLPEDLELILKNLRNACK